MKEIKAIVQPFRLEAVCEALEAIEGLPGLTVSQVAGWGKIQGREKGDVIEAGHTLAGKTKLEIVVPDEMVEPVVETIASTARTGNIGDGKIFIYAVDDVLKIRTGERGAGAI
ncbi:MAG: P-II family nitrogen regulator [Candidatus Krumholzibacteriia bacterium]